MTICIPVTEDNGTGSEVSEHFGRAPYHALVDLDSMETRVLRKEAGCTDGDHGHCLPVDFLLANDVDLVACKGIGRGALGRLMAHRIEVFAAHADTVAGVIEEYRRRRRTAGGMAGPRVCEGHHHH